MYRTVYIAAVLIALPLAGATVNARVTNAAGKPVENAVVYAVPARPLPLAQRLAKMDQVNRAFVPHVLPIQAGAWVEFPNSDKILHQVFSVSPIRRFTSPLYVGKPARPIQLPIAGVAAIGCSIHEEMTGYIIVVDTPYFATTAKSGKASIADVAAGDYTMRVWYPGMRTEPNVQALTVGASGEFTASFVTWSK